MAHYIHHFFLGQSYLRGSFGDPALTTVAPYPGDLLEVRSAADGPSPGEPVDLHEDHQFDKNDIAERPSSALGVVIYESGAPQKVVLTTLGHGGATIEELTNDGAADELLQRHSDFVDWCVANAHTCEFGDIFYEQGERNQRTGTTPAAYVTALQTLYDKMNDGVQAIMTAASMPQTHVIRMYQSQMDGWPEYPQEGAWPRIGLAQLEAHRTLSWHTLVGSRSHLERVGDQLHLKNTSYRHLGEMFGQAWVDGAAWEPAHPWSITRDGVFVSIRVHTRVWPLVFDTTHGFVTNYNLRYHDSADPSDFSTPSAHIVGVSLAGDTIILELNTVPTGSPGYISHGWIDRTANIRDSDTFVSSYDAEPLANWLTHFYDPIGLDLPPPTLPDELPTPTDFVVDGFPGVLVWAWNGASPSLPGLPTPTGFGVTASSGSLLWYWDELEGEAEPIAHPVRAELSYSTRMGTLSLASRPASMTRTSRTPTLVQSDA